jgi:REP-associated tyrosine transposase
MVAGFRIALLGIVAYNGTMARKPRVEFAGALYHVICRGNQRQVIFRSDADREYYLDRLEQYRERYGFKVCAYVLMSNHIHLLIETGKVPLSKIMQGLQLRYTGYFNKRYNKVGHLFQGRYKAILCDGDAYLLELVRYLHLNPERMRAAMDAGTYRWSSHRAYLGKESVVKIETAAVLGEFANSVGKARLGYLKFIAEGKAKGHRAEYYDVRDQRFLGDERFVEGIEERMEGEREIEVAAPRAKFPELLRVTALVYGASEKELSQAGRQRKWVKARSMLVYLGREWARVSVKELGKRLHRDPSIISRLYSAYAADRDQKKETLLAQRLRH